MTTKSIGVLCLAMMCGCVPPEECDEMAPCTIGQERFTQDVDETVAVTTKLLTIPNRNGSNMIALASADEMGIVRLQPRVSNFTSNVSLYVSARSPFIGHIEGPIDVFPLYKLSSTPQPVPILDIISFEEQPPQAPSRAAMVKTVTATLNGSGDWATGIAWKVTGRKRVRVTMSSPAAHTFTSAIVAYAGASTGATCTLDTKSIAGVTFAYADFAPTALYTTGATLPPPGVQTIDYVAVNSIGSGTASDPIIITLQAWDD